MMSVPDGKTPGEACGPDKIYQEFGTNYCKNNNDITVDSSNSTENPVIITEVPESIIKQSIDNMNTKGPHLRAATLTRTSAIEVIMEALSFLDKEAEQLRDMNDTLLVENNKVKEENDKLKKELDNLKAERIDISSKIEKTQSENIKLKIDIKHQLERYKEEKKHSEGVHKKLLEETAKFVKQLETLRKECTVKDAHLYEKTHEIDKLKRKVDELDNNNNEHYIELLHEVESLKLERQKLANEKGTTDQQNKQLKENINILERSLENKVSELSNESRRHFILTKEFNSLLEENNRIKQQMRNRVKSGTGSRLSSSTQSKKLRQPSAQTIDLPSSSQDIQGSLSFRRSTTQMSLPASRFPSNPNLMARPYGPVTEVLSSASSSSKVTQDDSFLNLPHNSLPSLAYKKGNWRP